MSVSERSKMQIAVLGGGLMGHGIAQVFAVAGHPVRVFDTDVDVLERLPRSIADGLAATGQPQSAAHLVEPHSVLEEAVSGAGLVIDAVREHLETKQALFAAVEAVVADDVILASNTSVIPITQIMCGLRRRERSLGTHWWNPPTLVPLVEVIGTEWTAPDVISTVMTVLASVGKEPVHVQKDIPGFVGNRLQHALWREAIALVANGVCDAATVDKVVKASFGRRLGVLGPLENADLVGTDLTLAVHDIVLADLDRSAEGLPFLRKMVAAGRLGMKSDEGFYKWTPECKAAVRARLNDALRTIEPTTETDGAERDN